MRAAVLHQPGEPLRIEDLELDDPRPGEVRVRVAAAGVCHSDYHYMTGDLPCRLPIVVGHEGSGTVEAVGEGVADVPLGLDRALPEERFERIAVGPIAYIRFHGGEGKYWGRYSDEGLLSWTDWILEQSRQGRSVWCYFNNDIHGHAIEDARTLKSMVGQMSP